VKSWSWILTGALGLALLDGVVSVGGGAERVGGFMAGAGKAVDWFVSPAVPAFSGSGSQNSGASLAEDIVQAPATTSGSPSSATTGTAATFAGPVATAAPAAAAALFG
jgi:hypothetical protein